MAYINGNKPIVVNGLVYALDFGNAKSYVSGTNRARSLVFDQATTIVTGSSAIPTLTGQGLNFTSNQWIQRSASLSALDPNGAFTICAVVKANTSGTLFTQNSSGGNLSGRFQSTSSLSTGFTLPTGDFSRIYTGNFTGSQHITYRYNSGSFDTFINGIPVTASVANAALTGSGLTSTLFINSGSLPFSGSLSSFYVYNRALTADEIYQNFEIASTRYGLPFRTKPYTIDENLYQFLQTTGITDTVTTNALATFISGLKSNGLWNKMVAIYPFVSNTTSSLTTNLKEPGIYRLGLTGSFSASAVGLTPSSSTAFIDTIPSNTAYSLVNSQSAHLTVLSYDLPTGNGFLAGNSLPALGGDVIIASGSKIYHAFKTVGTSSFTPLIPISNVEVLVVAGGGGGGTDVGGGGGAGGLVYSSSFSIVGTSSVQLTVGAGGLGNKSGVSTAGAPGVNSTFGSITAIGGGAGSNFLFAGGNGGSGGGTSRTGGPTGSGTPGQGNDGGNGAGTGNGGGGGGAGSPGIVSTGGSGSFFSQFTALGGWPAGWFAGGGGGSGNGRGGIGGGATGSISSYGGGTINNGVPNTGGGGGGGGYNTGGDGGSGIVIVGYDFPSTSTALTGSGTGIYLTETAITASVNSQFTSGITGSGNIGLLTVSRTQPATFSIHKNNVSQSVASASLGALPTDIFFNTANLAGSGSLPLQAGISFASIGSGLTTSEVATYHNLISQLQNNLKRQNTLLDNYSGAAAAYSLRRIGPSGYTGPAIRVRRDSDNALRDIGFTSDGQLDTVGLLDFVGVTGSGFVDTWYDQSGNNNNATQGTSANQPLVISSGSITLVNNKPALGYSLGGSMSLTFSRITNIRSVITYMNKFAVNAASKNIFLLGDQSSYDFHGGDNNASYFQPSFSALSVRNGNFYRNGTQISTTSSAVTDTHDILSLILSGSAQANTITQDRGNVRSLERPLPELIIFNTDQSSNRTAIESNINTNYKIYGSATASFDADYSAFITATGITQPTQSAALETLVSDLKSYGLWNKMKAIYPMITDRNNRLSDSQNLTNNWLQVSSSLTVSSSAAPDGTNTGFLFKETADTSEHYITRTVVDDIASGLEYVVSFHGRYLNRPWMAVKTDAGAQGWFNIQTGITGSFTGSNATVTAVSGGWYRCALYFTASASTGPRVAQFHLADADNSLSYAGNTASGSYIWGVQWENGNLLGPYRATSNGFTTSSMLDQMKFNLKNPVDTDAGFRIQYSGSWNGGYYGNRVAALGTANRGYTNFAPSLLPSNSIALGVYGTVPVESNQYEIGSSTGGSYTRLFMKYNGNSIFVDLNDGSATAVYGQGGDGFIIGSRLSNTTKTIYKNTSKYVRNEPVTGNNTSPLYLNENNNRTNFRFVFISNGLTDYEAKALYWIVQKYQTTLGRQVY